MLTTDKIYIAGHNGMVGSALLNAFTKKGFNNIITRTRKELDLCDTPKTAQFLHDESPDVVIIAAAQVGGIHANNTYPAEFIQNNLAIAQNLIHGSYLAKVKHLLFLGSSCIYPKNAPQPIKEEYLLTGPLEPTNEAYAVAKICGLKLCQYYRKQYGVLFHSAMPTNLYGPGDNYHPENSHVLPALLKRFHDAKLNNAPSVTLWGTGTPRREFLHVHDLAEAVIHLLNQDTPPDWVNLGAGSDVSIKELGLIIQEVTGYNGELRFDTSKPDGTPRKLLDSSLINNLGWQSTISLKQGIQQTYADFLTHQANHTLRL